MADAEDCERQPIPVPQHLPAGTLFALTHCTLWSVKGSSFAVTCDICGFSGTTSTHKLTYGHYLGQKGNDIQRCVSLVILEKNYGDWYTALAAKGSALAKKRK